MHVMLYITVFKINIARVCHEFNSICNPLLTQYPRCHEFKYSSYYVFELSLSVKAENKKTKTKTRKALFVVVKVVQNYETKPGAAERFSKLLKLKTAC